MTRNVATTSFWRVVAITALGAIAASLAPHAAQAGPPDRTACQAAVGHAKAQSDLQSVLSAAPDGSTVRISGTCVGTFTISNKTLTLTSKKGATIKGNTTGTVLWIGGNNQTTNVTMTNITVTNPNGQGIFVWSGATTLTLSTGVSVTGITRSSGIHNQGTVSLENASVSGNTNSGDGGGISNIGTLNLSGTTSISGNTAGGRGGGIYNSPDGTVTVVGSAVSISGNTSTGQGGGIYNEGTFSGTPTYDNNTPNNYCSSAGCS